MCICGNSQNFKQCCGAIILATRQAKTPEELMRSRYSAYVRADGRYLVQSTILENQHEEDAALIQEFSNAVTWLKLEVLATTQDTVEFKAYYKEGHKMSVLHEKSNFILENGIWKYKDGILYNAKVERNEPCPCGSKKKFKKCCAFI